MKQFAFQTVWGIILWKEMRLMWDASEVEYQKCLFVWGNLGFSVYNHCQKNLILYNVHFIFCRKEETEERSGCGKYSQTQNRTQFCPAPSCNMIVGPFLWKMSVFQREYQNDRQGKKDCPKCKTLQCPSWPLYLEAALGVMGAHPCCDPIASRCWILQHLAAPYMGGQIGCDRSSDNETHCSCRGRMTGSPASLMAMLGCWDTTDLCS